MVPLLPATPGAHTHPPGAHTHPPWCSHTHPWCSHTHTPGAHTHTPGAHTHTHPWCSHTHTPGAHTHTHTHTWCSHTPSLVLTHTNTPSGHPLPLLPRVAAVASPLVMDTHRLRDLRSPQNPTPDKWCERWPWSTGAREPQTLPGALSLLQSQTDRQCPVQRKDPEAMLWGLSMQTLEYDAPSSVGCAGCGVPLSG